MLCRTGLLRCVRLLLALLAMVGLFGRVVAPGQSMASDRMASDRIASDRAVIAALGGTLCHAGGSGPLAPDAPAPKPGADCVLCPVCAVAGSAGVLLVAAVALLAPTSVPRFQWAIAAARAPPAIRLIAAQPRGPPVLI